MTTEEANKDITIEEELKDKYTAKCVRYDIAQNDIGSLKVDIEQLIAINKILEDAVKFYADPYNYTPDRDAMYGKNLNNLAWEAQKQVEEIKKQGERNE